MKKAFSLFELILVVFISSIVIIYSLKFAKQTQEAQIKNQELAVLKIDMNSTKIIIEKNLPKIKEKLFYDGKSLFYEKNILLKNVSSFSMDDFNGILTIKITLDKKIMQTWEFKL